ncbi:unnamed protein product [Lepeophtheirus salmonis]|uniref:(salmon louse) hypothetical protein n=1 Tax=Lepeophtheirus salmonis TaxID=72036 RepID=A0A7R8D3R9_LEPSM|nr:unnamed protein product [Lepeophtheirus salmonis]CAF3019414.1 unnamed protein product [Lepeophtheirus salmonis]
MYSTPFIELLNYGTQCPSLHSSPSSIPTGARTYGATFPHDIHITHSVTKSSKRSGHLLALDVLLMLGSLDSLLMLLLSLALNSSISLGLQHAADHHPRLS